VGLTNISLLHFLPLAISVSSLLLVVHNYTCNYVAVEHCFKNARFWLKKNFTIYLIIKKINLESNFSESLEFRSYLFFIKIFKKIILKLFIFYILKLF